MSKPFKIFLIILTILFLIFIIWHFNIRIGLADYYFLKATRFNKGDKILKFYKKVFTYFPKEPKYKRNFATDLLWGLDKFYSSKDTKVKVLNLAIKRIKSIPEKERVFESRAYLARLYSKKAQLTEKKKDFEKAQSKIKKVSQIAPKMAGVYNDWCQLEIYQKDWDQALKKCQKALSLYPSLHSPKLNKSHRNMIEAEMSQIYEKLGIIFREKNDYGVAEQMYVQVIKYFPLQKKYIWKKIADLYYLQNELDQAVKNNLHGRILNPNDSIWPKALSILYQEKGNQEKAEFWSQKAKELQEN